MGDLSSCLLPDLRAGRRVVRLRIDRVVELVGEDRARGLLDDGETDPVLHRTAWIVVLRLGEDRCPDSATDSCQPDERGPSDGVEHGVVRLGVSTRHGAALREREVWNWTGWRNAAATGRP